MRLLLVVVARPLWTSHHTLQIRVFFAGRPDERRVFLLPLVTSHCFGLLPFLLRLLPMPFFE